MNACPAPTASAAIATPSISWCGFFIISSRSLNAPGSDSSALQHTYLRISPCGRNEPFLPIEKPAPPRPRRPESSNAAEQVGRVELAGRPARARGSRRGCDSPRSSPARARRCAGRAPGLPDVRQRPCLPAAGRASGSGPPAAGRRASSLSGSGSAPRAHRSIAASASASVERAVVAVVERGHRRQVAGAEALEALDEELAVGGGGAVVRRLVGIGTGGLAERLEQLVAAAHPAGDVGADEHPVGADRLGGEQVVEGGHRLEVGGGDPHHRSRLADPVRRAPAVARCTAHSAGIEAERSCG